MRFLFLVGSVVLVSVCLQHETCPTDVHQSKFSVEGPAAYDSYQTSPIRRKRKIFIASRGNSLGFKQTVWNLIFASFRKAATPPPTTTIDEVPQFNRTGVELDVNEYVTAVIFNISKDTAMVLNITFLNTADRIHQLVEAAKPFMAAKLGLDISASSFTTTEPIESLVPRLGPPLGGDSAGTSATSTQDISVNRTDRSGKPAV